jgi:tRNA A37 threonylcarbamoyladenosine modification protein TsaB
MIWTALSTSAPLISVAVFREDALLGSRHGFAPGKASDTCLQYLIELLNETGLPLQEVTLFAADIGPGSFTGIKVGVTIAKTLAYSLKGSCSPLLAFDLIDPHQSTAIPVTKGKYLLRLKGEEPLLVPESDERLSQAIGYGDRYPTPQYPLAENARLLYPHFQVVSPMELVPYYGLEPSISLPKKPYKRVDVE